MGDLRREPATVLLDQVGRARRTQGGHEQRQRVDSVLEHVARPVEVVDRRRDVAPASLPGVERVGERGMDAIALADSDERWR